MAPAFPHRQDLRPLLCPESVAIVGISTVPRFGGWVYENLKTLGYPGRIDFVNPRYTEIHGQACYPSLRELPAVPECAVLAVPNDRLLAALQDAAAIGVQAAVIAASAYSAPEAGAPSLQDQLREVAQAAGIRVCGPNGMGLIGFASRFAATGYPVTARRDGGNLAFITHSGTVFDSVWQQGQRGLSFNYLVSSGNEITTTLADYVQFALEDPATRAIGLFLETVRDPATFRVALSEAAERDVPVVALKVGRSARGAQLAQTHSGAVAGDDAVYDAVFAQYGVQRVQSLDEMLDTLELFAAGLRPPTRYITSIHDSGGQRGLLVDLAEAAGVAFAPINAATTEKLAAILEPGLTPTNPLDAWGTGNDFGRIFRESLLALDSDPSTGLNVWVADLYAAGTVSETYANEAIAHKDRFSRPLVFLANLAAAVDAGHAGRLRAAGLPVLLGTENGLRAIAHLLDYAAFQRERQAPAAPGPPITAPPSPTQVAAMRQQLAAASGALGEFESKALLRGYGLPAPPEAVAHSLAELMQAAQAIGYPVALKTAAEGVLHKSDQGGVLLDLPDLASVSRAYRSLVDRFGPRVLVQRMVPPGLEIILGIVVDPQFGPLLSLGLGGVYVEVFKDFKLLAVPTTAERVRAALFSLRSAPVLRGTRGQPPVAVDAIVDAALRLAALAADLGDLLAGVDVNPLIASPTGVQVVDALIVVRASAPGVMDGSKPAAGEAHASERASGPQRWRPDEAVPAPLALLEGRVLPAWIDYNGHMTEASYLAAFGDASDALFRYVGIDEGYRASGHSFYTVETHLNYYQEALSGEPLRFTTQLLGLDEKRLHLFHSVSHGVTGTLLATTEQMLVHVHTQASGAVSAPILPEVYAALQSILAAHRRLPLPKQAGRQIGLRKTSQPEAAA